MADDRNSILEEAALLADAYAEENERMAHDTIILDPVLSGKSSSAAALAMSKDMMIDGCVHSSMMHAARNIAAAIRGMKS